MSHLILLTLLLAAPRPVPAMTGGIRIHEDDDRRWARFVEGAGLDTVQVTFYADQLAWDGGEIEYWRAALDDWPGVEAEVRAARARGLQVMLVLRLKLDRTRPHNRFLWHGMVQPRDEATEAWFDAYRAFALWGAARAAEMGVELLVIGHELNSMTATTPLDRLPDLLHYHLDPERTGAVVQSRLRCAARAGASANLTTPDGATYPSLRALLGAEDDAHRSWARQVSGLQSAPPTWPAPMPPALAARRARYARFWRELAAELRTVYPGPLAYGANFDQYAEVDFWDAVDAIAISSYFPLRPYDTPDAQLDARLELGWRRAAASIEQVARRVHRPVVLHELGLSRKAGSTMRPYSYDGVEPIEREDGRPGSLACVDWSSQPDDPTERTRALDALLRVIEGGAFPSLRAVSLWKLTTEPVHRAHETFAVVLPPPYVERDADDDFVYLAGQLAELLRAHAR